MVQAGDLWERIVSILSPVLPRDSSPRSGKAVPPAEIAARVGLHEASVRRILCDLGTPAGL